MTVTNHDQDDDQAPTDHDQDDGVLRPGEPSRYPGHTESGPAPATGASGRSEADTATPVPPAAGHDHEAPTPRPMIQLRHGMRFMTSGPDGSPEVYDDPVFLTPEQAAKIPPDVLVKYTDHT